MGDVLYDVGDVAEEMTFLSKGTVRLSVNDSSHESTVGFVTSGGTRVDWLLCVWWIGYCVCGGLVVLLFFVYRLINASSHSLRLISSPSHTHSRLFLTLFLTLTPSPTCLSGGYFGDFEFTARHLTFSHSLTLVPTRSLFLTLFLTLPHTRTLVYQEDTLVILNSPLATACG